MHLAMTLHLTIIPVIKKTDVPDANVSSGGERVDPGDFGTRDDTGEGKNRAT